MRGDVGLLPVKEREDGAGDRSSRFGRATRWIAPLTALALASLVAACGDDQAPQEARRLYDRIQAASYRSWRRAPGYEQRRRANAPHSEEVDIYVSDVVARAIDEKKPLREWPEGAIIAKDGFDGDDHELLAVMEKRRDGWF